MDRQAVIAEAERIAQRNDEEVAKRLVKQLVPRTQALIDYGTKQRQMAATFATPEDPAFIGVKRG